MHPLIQIYQQIDESNKVFYLKDHDPVLAKGNVCLYHELGNLIDVLWDSQKGNFLLSPSNATVTTYTKIGVEFRHAHICPYLEKQFIKSEKLYKPCACVLISHQDNILVTRRKLTLNSFPGAWVLPGGHLEKGQGFIQGGLRQAQQEVGLDNQTAQVVLQHGIMAWQSAFCVQGKIVSSSFVMFLTVLAPWFQVKPQQSQIQEFIWKEDKSSQDQYRYTSSNKNGYGQAHLNYLSFYRNKRHNIPEEKKWIQEIELQKLSMQVEQSQQDIKFPKF